MISFDPCVICDFDILILCSTETRDSKKSKWCGIHSNRLFYCDACSHPLEAIWSTMNCTSAFNAGQLVTPDLTFWLFENRRSTTSTFERCWQIFLFLFSILYDFFGASRPLPTGKRERRGETRLNRTGTSNNTVLALDAIIRVVNCLRLFVRVFRNTYVRFIRFCHARLHLTPGWSNGFSIWSKWQNVYHNQSHMMGL